MTAINPTDRFISDIGSLANCGTTPNEMVAASAAFANSFNGSVPGMAVAGNLGKNAINNFLDISSVSIFLPLIIFYIVIILTLGLSGVITAMDTLMLIIIGVIFVYIFSLIYRLGVGGSLAAQARNAARTAAEIYAANIVPAVDNAAMAYVAASKQATQAC